ncbi:MAG TPA: hypothetical protein DDZ66_13735 [Firmicutes bacterium]|nr:hypothetical protein [Bacillota bacterium]
MPGLLNVNIQLGVSSFVHETFPETSTNFGFSKTWARFYCVLRFLFGLDMRGKKMLEIAFEGIQKFYGANEVLKNITFEVKQGEIVGLLGKSGAGKTTLFKILSGNESIDSGRKIIRKGAAVGLLDQIADFPRRYTAYDVLLEVFENVREIGDQLEEPRQSWRDIQRKKH